MHAKACNITHHLRSAGNTNLVLYGLASHSYHELYEIHQASLKQRLRWNMATKMGLPYDLDSVDDNMSDEQIDQLLQNAERRLNASPASSPPKSEKLPSHQ